MHLLWQGENYATLIPGNFSLTHSEYCGNGHSVLEKKKVSINLLLKRITVDILANCRSVYILLIKVYINSLLVQKKKGHFTQS